MNDYLSDSQRDQFVEEACKYKDNDQICMYFCYFTIINLNIYVYKGYAVTIIVEGGFGSLEVLENDIGKNRPIVLIQVCFIYSHLYVFYFNELNLG